MSTARFSGRLHVGGGYLPRGGGVHTPLADTPCPLYAGTHTHIHTPCEQNNWQTGVKTLPSRNFIYRNYGR